MRVVRKLGLLAVCMLGIAAPCASEPLTEFPDSVVALLAKHKLAAANLSVYVQDVNASAPLLTVNAQVPRNPASVMKLVTTVVGLHELGPSYRFRTDIYADQAPEKGKLNGNLYLKGGGDPFMVTEAFWRMLKDLRYSGLEHVTGDLVIDGSYFQVPDVYRGDFDGRPHRAYNVLPHAALVNFFASTFKFYADEEARRVRIEVDPPMSTLKLDNEVKFLQGKCSWRRRKLGVRLVSLGPRPHVRVTGTFPARCGPFELLRAVADPVPYVFGAFEPMWQEMGGRIDGEGRQGLVPDSAIRLQRTVSPPLADLIRYINKHSNNVMTRNLLLALGARTYGAPGTVEKGQRAVADWMLLHDIPASELRLDNGSGLSRDGQISTLSLARLLLQAWKSPFRSEFVSSLALSAFDGTLRNRLRASDLEGMGHMKTGLLDDVRTIAGFLRTRDGRDLVVVSLHNEAGVHQGTGTAVQDALLEWLFEQ